MDLPLKLEIPKLSHTNVTGLLLPFVPGAVLIIGLGIDHPSIVQSLNIIGLGYKTKLLLITLSMYVMGLATTQVVASITSLIHNQLVPVRSIHGHKNVYWRRLVEAYLGSDLLPIPHESREEADRTLDHFVSSGLSPSEAKESLKRIDERIASLKKPVEDGRAAIQKMKEMGREISPELPTALESVSTALSKSESLEREFVQVIGKANLDLDWIGLYSAIYWLHGAEPPFSVFGEIALSFQTASLVAIWLMIHMRHFWGVSATLFCFLLLAVSSWTKFKIYRLSNLHQAAAAPEIAAMLAVLKPEAKDR